MSVGTEERIGQLRTEPTAGLQTDGSLFKLAQGLAAAGVAGMLAIAAITCLDVIVLRAIFNSPIPGSNELLSTVFGVGIAAVLAGGAAQKANLRVDVLGDVVSPHVFSWLTIVGSFLLLLFFCFLSWRVLDQAGASLTRHVQTVILQLPLAPFQFAIAGFLALCVPVQMMVLIGEVQSALGDGAPERRLHRAIAIALAVLVAAVLVSAAGYFGIELLRSVATSNMLVVGVAFFALIWVFIIALVPVGPALGVVGFLGTALIIGFPGALSVLGSETAQLFANADLALIPLFLMMGSFAVVSGLSSDVYRLSQSAFGAMRGGVAMATIGGAAGFGALTGSSLATAVTIGAVGLPEMRKRGYERGFAAGCVAAGATLGVLIPPSTIVVLYGILTEQSIGRLYMAILLPGVLSTIFYLIAIALLVRIRRQLVPDQDSFSLRQLLFDFRRSIAVFVLFGLVMGGIFFGVFTVTEAAAVGAVLSFAVALLRRSINRDNVWTVAAETTRSVAMIYVLIIGALMTAYFFALTGLPTALTEIISASGLSPLMIILLFCGAYLALGTVMESVTIMLITAPVVAPIVIALGYDPLWWGVVTVMIVELGVITPPFGVNLFLLKQISNDTSIRQIYFGVLPFVAVDLVKIGVLIAFPILATWLPSLAF